MFSHLPNVMSESFSQIGPTTYVNPLEPYTGTFGSDQYFIHSYF